MNQEHWRRLKEIIADALDEDNPSARTALLARECAEDAILLREAESFLVQADTIRVDEVDGLEECAAITTATLREGANSMTGRRIGAYVIVRELGHGGMATVYLAARADGYFEKQVAIKVLKPGGGKTVELLARFRAEREVLASLEHPNIATLFDAGMTEEGMPYFVMEYVSGTPVTTYIRQHQLPIRERLALFLKICAAVEVAHRKRIVHRDLKRSNILVNEDAEPKLLDFGIAKLLEEHPLAITATGQQRLTPISASPEQARGEAVTTASDVYALGALLYEILTGTTPHVFETTNPDLEEVTRVVSEKEPVLPSLAVKDQETRRVLRGDLDAIVFRAMRKNPAERYSSVGGLAEDIRHYLTGEAVHARPDKLQYRVQRFTSRHKILTGRVLATGIAVIAVLGTMVFLIRHAQETAVSTQSKPVTEIPEKSIAVLPFDDFGTPDGASYFADGVQDDILTDLASVADLKVISRSGVTPYRKAPRNLHDIGRQLGIAYVLEGSVRKLGDRVRVNAQLIDTRTDSQVWAEQYDRKMDDLFALQSALAQAIVTQLKGKLSPSEKAAIESRPTTNMVAYDSYLRARQLFVNYKYEEAIKLLSQAIALDPNFALAYCLLTNVHLYIYRFGDDPSEAHLTQAKAAAETALRIAPELPESHLAQAQYYYNGLRDYEKAQAELASAPPSPAGRAQFFDLSALTERRLGHWKEAVRDAEKAWELDPHDPFIATELIQSYMALRRYSEAETLAEEAIRNIPSRSAPFWSEKADAILARGDTQAARAVLQNAPEDSEQSQATLAMCAYYERNYPEALREMELAGKSSMPPPFSYCDLMAGEIARAQGDMESSRRFFEKARVELEASVAKHPNHAPILVNLAWAYAGLGRKEDAMRTCQQAVQLIPSWRDAVEGPNYAAMQALVHTWLGDKNAALDQLTMIVKRAGGPSYGGYQLDPSWDRLRDDPRFENIIAESKRQIPID